KKPWRYRWPDETRDEILARLLQLNQQRHTSRNPAPHKPTTPLAYSPQAASGGRRRKRPPQNSLFPVPEQEK
ncbi:MAG: hypothetical protein ACP5QA_14550, partial [Phycisphaerae bacterium]